MAAYSMPFHVRDVLGSYPSAQIAAVDRDTQIFRYGQIFENIKNPNRRLVAARTLAGISPEYQEARIQSLAGDNFSQKAFQAEQRESMALQKKYIQDRTEYMEQKTNNRLLRGSLVQALGSGGRTTGDRTPFADLDLDENFDIGSGTGSGSGTPGSRYSVEQMRQIMGTMEAFPQQAGLSDSFWGSGGSSAVSQSGESEESRLDLEYGMGVDPIALNIDPLRLQRIEAVRAIQAEERARQEVVGSLTTEMVSEVAGFSAIEQERERQNRLRALMYETGIFDVENPGDMSEDQLRIVARTREAQARRGFFGRAEMLANETFLEQPLEIESAEMGGASLQEMLATVDEFGARGSLALAGGGVARRVGRPTGFRVSEESKARRAETLAAQRRFIQEQEALGVEFPGGMRSKMAMAKTMLAGEEAERALLRSRGIQRMARKQGFGQSAPEEGSQFSLFD